MPEKIGFIINTCFPNAHLKTVRGGVELWVGIVGEYSKRLILFKKGHNGFAIF